VPNSISSKQQKNCFFYTHELRLGIFEDYRKPYRNNNLRIANGTVMVETVPTCFMIQIKKSDSEKWIENSDLQIEFKILFW
jgi:hypothetical protein